jgi:Sec-independent protein translocase protein TatA
MFNLGLGEIILILLVAICVTKPKDWPKIARFCGKITAKAKNTVRDIKQEINKHS